MNSLLKKYQVVPIDALGEIFDPNLHEAISIISDPKLDDNTITKENISFFIILTNLLK